jgi:hypothetical protein
MIGGYEVGEGDRIFPKLQRLNEERPLLLAGGASCPPSLAPALPVYFLTISTSFPFPSPAALASSVSI